MLNAKLVSTLVRHALTEPTNALAASTLSLVSQSQVSTSRISACPNAQQAGSPMKKLEPMFVSAAQIIVPLALETNSNAQLVHLARNSTS